MIELKPCPFCGGQAVMENETEWIHGRSRGYGRVYVMCRTCCCRTMGFDADERGAEREATDAWNRRAYDKEH